MLIKTVLLALVLQLNARGDPFSEGFYDASLPMDNGTQKYLSDGVQEIVNSAISGLDGF